MVICKVRRVDRQCSPRVAQFVMFNKPKITRREKRDSVSNILEGPYIRVTATSNVRIEVDVTMYRKERRNICIIRMHTT